MQLDRLYPQHPALLMWCMRHYIIRLKSRNLLGILGFPWLVHPKLFSSLCNVFYYPRSSHGRYHCSSHVQLSVDAHVQHQWTSMDAAAFGSRTTEDKVRWHPRITSNWQLYYSALCRGLKHRSHRTDSCTGLSRSVRLVSVSSNYWLI